MMCVGACATGRNAVTECMKWATQRKVFGKRLIDQPVIRFKLARMVILRANDSILIKLCVLTVINEHRLQLSKAARAGLSILHTRWTIWTTMNNPISWLVQLHFWNIKYAKSVRWFDLVNWHWLTKNNIRWHVCFTMSLMMLARFSVDALLPKPVWADTSNRCNAATSLRPFLAEAKRLWPTLVSDRPWRSIPRMQSCKRETGSLFVYLSYINPLNTALTFLCTTLRCVFLDKNLEYMKGCYMETGQRWWIFSLHNTTDKESTSVPSRSR